jgi:hydrogenase maturation protease
VSDTTAPVLVIGIGNTLLRDEGAGVLAVRELEAAAASSPLPAGVQLVDGGTLGLDLLPLVEEAEALVLIDAIESGSAPGSVCVLRDAEVEARLGGKLSAHQIGVGDLVAVARLRGTLPAHTSLVGIQPAHIEVGLELSGEVAEALPDLVAQARAEVIRLATDEEPSG